MRRIMMLLMVVALMTTMLAVAAGPASAQYETKLSCKEDKPIFKGNPLLFGNQGQCIKQVNHLPF